MNKSSLSKIVRTYIEQAKDGCSNNYTIGKSTSTCNPIKKTTTSTKIKSTVNPERCPLVRKNKGQAGEIQNINMTNSKNMSLNNSQLANSPSRSRTPPKKNIKPLLTLSTKPEIGKHLRATMDSPMALSRDLSKKNGLFRRANKAQVSSKVTQNEFPKTETNDDYRLTERRGTAENQLIDSGDEDINHMKSSGKKKESKARENQNNISVNSKTNRGQPAVSSIPAPSHFKTSNSPPLAKPGLSNTSSFKEKDHKVFSNGGSIVNDKFIARRKVIVSNPSSGANNGSFTFKGSLPTNVPKLSSTTMKLPQSSQSETRKYALPNEIFELDSIMKESSLEDFSMQHLLGKGAYASTYLGIHTSTNLGVAMKVYIYNDKNTLRESIESEVSILMKLNHPNVVKLYAAFDKPNKSILVLE